MIFEISGDPIPLKRHRTVLIGRRTIQYDAQKKEKAIFAKKAIAALGENRENVFSKDFYKVEIQFELPFPESRKRKNMPELATIPHTTKPDLDNLVKFVLDAGNGVIWEDDKKIVSINAKKVYSSEPKTKIYIMP